MKLYATHMNVRIRGGRRRIGRRGSERGGEEGLALNIGF